MHVYQHVNNISKNRHNIDLHNLYTYPQVLLLLLYNY